MADPSNELVEPQQLQWFHKYKHQRATLHLIDLYGACLVDSTEPDKAETAVKHLKIINSRIQFLNHELGLPSDLGVIDYGVFQHSWELKQDRQVVEQGLKRYCATKRYMQGWSNMPPTHDYSYFPEPEEPDNDEWDILVPWLRLIWALLKKRPRLEAQLVLLDDIEGMLLEYLGDPGEDLSVSPCDALTAIISLHEMSRLAPYDAGSETGISIQDYEIERENLRRMCEFQGFPCTWIPLLGMGGN
ncbi:uncharacterized protein KD926_002085 [Aspergillus affinis]|uniref:uncharacterized protein n=1 Tax=Aspergillus affinis TaxID=1070780 RepID=UPI0022FF29E5|nr:uncharacterized protein KD926_002085 [Aspergillus affinis]KAI9036321.1 hypothetical protein KD926_002085 [Aspergillus affinis]